MRWLAHGLGAVAPAGRDRRPSAGSQGTSKIVMNVDDLAQRGDIWPGEGCRTRIDHDRQMTVDLAGVERPHDNLQPDRVQQGDGGQVDHEMRSALIEGIAELAGQHRRCEQVYAAGYSAHRRVRVVTAHRCEDRGSIKR